MATDIAFVVGCMAVLGPRVPHILRVMLLSLAIVDDIGAILVIAVGYTESLNLTALLLAFAGLGVVYTLGRLGVRSFGIYVILGVGVWFGFHESGVHATLAGVLMGLLTPARSYLGENTVSQMLQRADKTLHGGDWVNMHHRSDAVRRFTDSVREVISPLEYLEGTLHPWTAFVIMPVFALANAGLRSGATSGPCPGWPGHRQTGRHPADELPGGEADHQIPARGPDLAGAGGRRFPVGHRLHHGPVHRGIGPERTVPANSQGRCAGRQPFGSHGGHGGAGQGAAQTGGNPAALGLPYMDQSVPDTDRACK